MEAALRTVYELVTGRELPFEGLHVTPIVGLELVKEAASVILRDTCCPPYRLPGGGGRRGWRSPPAWRGRTCLMRDDGNAGTVALPLHRGHGLPRRRASTAAASRARNRGGGLPGAAARARCTAEDEGKPLRKSHENPDLLRLYETWLGEAGGPLAHELLHTRYVPRGLYNERVPDDGGKDAPQAGAARSGPVSLKTKRSGTGEGQDHDLRKRKNYFASDARRPRPHHRRGSASGPPAERRHGHPRAAYGRAGADGHFPSSQGCRSTETAGLGRARPGVDGDGPGRAGRSQPVGRVHGDDVRKAATAAARRAEAAS